MANGEGMVEFIMAKEIKFKVYLMKENPHAENKYEIRKFSIMTDGKDDLNRLHKQLETVFPSVKEKKITIFWKDKDVDDIVISSVEELQIALKENKNLQEFKLFVTVHPDNSEDTKPIHFGVYCNECLLPNFHGFRYKCLECKDYDLCDGCESKGLHDKHCMIRITEPIIRGQAYGKRYAITALIDKPKL